jgi:hypothetical protein
VGDGDRRSTWFESTSAAGAPLAPDVRGHHRRARIQGATGGGSAPSAADIASAVLAALQATSIPVNMVQVKGQTITGSGSEADPWGPG